MCGTKWCTTGTWSSGLRAKGAVFVEELDEVPDGATMIFSAHGVSTAVEQEAVRRGLQVFDATCPLVTKVHMEVARFAREGREVILIGHAGHPEVEGTIGRFDTAQGGTITLVQSIEDVATLEVRDPERLAFVTQTTLSVDDTANIVAALRRRFPSLQAPKREDICYATQNRQDAVKKLLSECDLLIVVGSRSSSNSNRLRELAERSGVTGLPGRQSGRASPGVVRGQAERRRHRRRLGSGSAGAEGGRAAPQLGRPAAG